MTKRKNRRYSKPKITLAAIISISLIFTFYYIAKHIFKGKTEDQVSISELSKTEKSALRKYNNDYHLEIAKRKGLKKPLKSQKEANEDKKQFSQNYKLVKLSDNKFYEIPHLSNSLPYLHADAEKFLKQLGRRFTDRLEDNDLRPYRFSVTSILRTLEDQKLLRKSNVNATYNNSSHYYGRTFDIAQTRFFDRGNSKPVYSYRLRNELLRELIEMQNEGKCYVLLESQTKCIHVTVR